MELLKKECMNIKLLSLTLLLSIVSGFAMVDPKNYLRQISPDIVEKDQSFTVILGKHEKGNGWIVVDSEDATFKRSYALPDENGMEIRFKARKRGFVKIIVHDKNQNEAKQEDIAQQYRNFSVRIFGRE